MQNFTPRGLIDHAILGSLRHRTDPLPNLYVAQDLRLWSGIVYSPCLRLLSHFWIAELCGTARAWVLRKGHLRECADIHKLNRRVTVSGLVDDRDLRNVGTIISGCLH
jgi:hypothetical protein